MQNTINVLYTVLLIIFTYKSFVCRVQRCLFKHLLGVTIKRALSFLKLMILHGKLLQILITAQIVLLWKHDRLVFGL